MAAAWQLLCRAQTAGQHTTLGDRRPHPFCSMHAESQSAEQQSGKVRNQPQGQDEREDARTGTAIPAVLEAEASSDQAAHQDGTSAKYVTSYCRALSCSPDPECLMNVGCQHLRYYASSSVAFRATSYRGRCGPDANNTPVVRTTPMQRNSICACAIALAPAELHHAAWALPCSHNQRASR